MISIIICSITPGMLDKLKANISTTIGVDFELIAIDNRVEKKGICQVYNDAAKITKFNILCFIHEDVLIHSNNWGWHLANLLEDESIGLVGVSGSVYKSAIPSIWSACEHSFYRLNTIQHFSNQSQPVKTLLNSLPGHFEEVAVLDGVFLATKKSVFANHSFDEIQFTGFHCYDLDLSLNIGTKYKLAVSNDILLEHFSEGKLNKDWITDSLQLHKKWAAVLPKQVGKINTEQKKRSDFISCSSFLQQLLIFPQSKKMILNYYCRLIFSYWKYNHLAYTKAVFKNLVKFKS